MENFVFPDENRPNWIKCRNWWTFFLFWLEFRKKATNGLLYLPWKNSLKGLFILVWYSGANAFIEKKLNVKTLSGPYTKRKHPRVHSKMCHLAMADGQSHGVKLGNSKIPNYNSSRLDLYSISIVSVSKFQCWMVSVSVSKKVVSKGSEFKPGFSCLYQKFHQDPEPYLSRSW